MATLRQRSIQRNPEMQLHDGADADGVKMSEVIEDFLEPYQDSTATAREYRMLLNVGLIAWNLSLFPEQKQSPELDRLIAKLPEEGKEMGKDLVKKLMARKKQLFSWCRRMVVDFELTDTAGSWHLSVTSTLDQA